MAALAALALTASQAARADEKATCADAYGKAQTLRDAHQLTAARQQLRVCARTSCTGFIAKDCTAWLVDLESRLPSVVLTAKDARGSGLVDVTVSMDGSTIATRLDGRSIDVDPGQHTFRFATPDGSTVEQSVVVLEGQKAQRVSATIGSSPAPETSPGPAAPPSAPPAEVLPPPDRIAPSWSGRKTLAVVVAGVGVAGIGVGSFFGVSAMSSWSNAQNECPSAGCIQRAQAQADHDSAATSSTISTIAFIAGGALVAAGGVLFLTAPSHGEETAVARPSLRVAPTAGPGVTGITMQGSF
jgi:hypothetical protein